MTCRDLFWEDLLWSLGFHLTVTRVCLSATSCSSDALPVVFKHQLLAQNFGAWCCFFINFNMHIVSFCWYQPFHGTSLPSNALGKIARNKTSWFTLIQIWLFIKWPLPFRTCHSPKPRTTGVHATLPWEKWTRQGKYLQKKKQNKAKQLIVLLIVFPQSV